jgi:hypothetical protein
MGFYGFFALALGLVVATSATAEWDRAEALSAIHGDMSRFLLGATLKTWAKEYAPPVHKYAHFRGKEGGNTRRLRRKEGRKEERKAVRKKGRKEKQEGCGRCARCCGVVENFLCLKDSCPRC